MDVKTVGFPDRPNLQDYFSLSKGVKEAVLEMKGNPSDKH